MRARAPQSGASERHARMFRMKFVLATQVGPLDVALAHVDAGEME